MKSSLTIALIYFVLLPRLILSAQSATSIYVSPSGNDLDSGVSPDRALKTIAAAVTKAAPGDEIRLLPGTYYGKTTIRNQSGMAEHPITIMSHSHNAAEFAIIDGGSQPGIDLPNSGFEIHASSWITFSNLQFRNCWTDVIVLENASYISFIGCNFQGGRRVIYPRGAGSHHFLVENCHWEQDEKIWTTFFWDEMHHGSQAYYNGALFHPTGTAGSYVVRGNTIINVFNGLRTYPEAYNQDGNGEIYNNAFINIADNALEPEQWAWNLHFYHNTLHNIHKAFSIDNVKGGPLYIYGNVETQDTNPNAIAKVSGIWKFKDGPLTRPCYVFNNSFYTEATAFKDGEATNDYMEHFNNAYHFFDGLHNLGLNDWDGTFQFDHDCSSMPWPVNIAINNQELHGIVADALFVNGPGRDLRLQPGSPCIDAGKVMSFPELDWTQSFEGLAPDIGAFEGNQLVEGPPFQFKEPPGGSLCQEKPRIVWHQISDRTLKLYFSIALAPATANQSAVHIFLDEVEIPVLAVSFPENFREMAIIASQPLIAEKISLYLDPLPLGVNGESATHWASTIRVAKRKSTAAVRASEERSERGPLSIHVYPNPFNAHALIKVSGLSTSAHVASAGGPEPSLFIYDIAGRHVKEIYPFSSTGNLIYQLDGTGMATGIYFAVVWEGKRCAITKLALLR